MGCDPPRSLRIYLVTTAGSSPLDCIIPPKQLLRSNPRPASFICNSGDRYGLFQLGTPRTTSVLVRNRTDSNSHISTANYTTLGRVESMTQKLRPLLAREPSHRTSISWNFVLTELRSYGRQLFSLRQPFLIRRRRNPPRRIRE